MKTILTLSLILTTALFAQTPPAPTPPTPPPTSTPGPEATPPDQPPAAVETTTETSVDFGSQGMNNDTGSARFIEYRDIPTGPVLPLFRVRTSASNYDLQLAGENTARTDQHYFLRANSSVMRVTVDYNQIPHRFGVGHTLEQETSRGVYQINDTVQRSFQTSLEQAVASKTAINFPFLLGVVTPSLNAANSVDLELLRKRAFVDFQILPEARVDTHVTYFIESRSGNRAAGTSFGFSNVVETPEPINYRTMNLGLTGEMPFKQGLVRGGLAINRFEDTLSSYTFDNPFRAVDSTDVNAYTAPGASSINGPAVGRIASPPDNEALNGSLGFVYKLPMQSRFTANLNLGRWTQNDRFMPYTTNVAITSPLNASDINALPARSLNGRVNTTGGTLQFTSTPIKHLNVSARWRYYDFDNQTRRIQFPGYVRFDAVWEPIGRINVPYSYMNNRADVTATYDFGKASVETGFRSETRHRNFREVSRDRENVARLGGDIRPFKWATFRASYEFGNRNINGYNSEIAEDASYIQEQTPVQPETLRRYDVNARRVSRLVSDLQVTPFDGNFSVNFNYVRNLDRYKDVAFGLQRWNNDSFTTEADYARSDRWSTYAFFSNEHLGGIQVAEQNSSGVLTLDPRNDWIAHNTDRVKSVGAGLNFTVIPQKVDTRFLLRHQRANGNASLSATVPNTNLKPSSIPNFDDTKLWTTTAELTYHIRENVDLAAGGWIEKYELNDAESSNLPNYTPGSFFLSPNFLDYRGTVAYIRAAYHW